uniref:Secreted protein n=1 Tax=Tetranychus urticae TaxID=32264 RepID=T1KD62_TETUR
MNSHLLAITLISCLVVVGLLFEPVAGHSLYQWSYNDDESQLVSPDQGGQNDAMDGYGYGDKNGDVDDHDDGDDDDDDSSSEESGENGDQPGDVSHRKCNKHGK